MSSNDIFIRNSDTNSNTTSDTNSDTNSDTTSDTTSDTNSDIELTQSPNTEEVNIMLNVFFNQNNDIDSGYYSE
jgi:hypothetical protein